MTRAANLQLDEDMHGVPLGPVVELKVELIIWDLRSAFWDQSVGDGAIGCPTNLIVLTLAKRGIVSSICLEEAKSSGLDFLRKTGLMPFFAFSLVGGHASPRHIERIVAKTKLELRSFLYISDCPHKRAAAMMELPGLLVCDENVIPDLLGDPLCSGQSDPTLDRLKTFKQWEADILQADASKWPAIPPSPAAQPFVTASMAAPAGNLADALRHAYEDATAGRGRLPEAAFAIHGFSGKKIRLFFNNVMRELGDARYLEIGLYHGASFCPAVFGNRIQAVGVDNWTEYNGDRKLFDNNLTVFASPDAKIQIVEKDFRKIDFPALGKFNIMFYDGPHSEQDQYDGITLPFAAMDERFILVVDDWNWNHVRAATYAALRHLKARVDYCIETRTTFNGDFPAINGAGSDWHNGLFCAVISKS